MLLKRLSLTVTALAWTGAAAAAVSPEEAAQLGKSLTAIGAEAGASKDGTIPAYSGGLKEASAGSAGAGQLADPYAADKPVLTINKANLAQHADKLTAGTKALLERYATFRADVYPTRRSVAFPQNVTDNTRACATTAKLTRNGESMEGCLAGYPFPIPKTGQEAIWNHLVRYSGRAYESRFENYNVNAGRATLATAATNVQDFPYWDPAKSGADTFLRLKNNFTGPARRAGEQFLIIDPLSYADTGRRAWQYLPGQRRVKLAPNLAFDTPNPGTAGATTFDDTFIFNGSLERYDFQLVGKQEMIVPYNAYRLVFAPSADQVFKADHVNPDVVRWELHRVWVVDATLKTGKRHVYAKRRFYLDEDSWSALASDEYDARGQLYRAGFAFQTPRYTWPAPNSDSTVHYDLIAGIYAFTGFLGGNGGTRAIDPPAEREWNADALAGSGVR
ncbi:MAG TPA: DUF1329 domain-containing protein [Nevskiaceae bacterium]|nr:DUF1329 domain-containing protein [Nevskiaceae bacterium]